MSERLRDLNPDQRQAVETVAGPLLVLAGAGSGKTRVLTYRIAHLIEEVGIAPWNILAVTFTNKAAGEMRERIEQLVGSASERIWVGTFHSVCARILRYEATSFGLDSSFTIYDEDDRRSLIRRILSDLNIPEQELTARAAVAQVSRAKNGMVDARAFTDKTDATASTQRQHVADVYSRYESELTGNNALDFDDLICEPVRRFGEHADVLEKYRDRFRHILIDEYQDTNRPQYLLSKMLAQEHRDICCVGDDDQSIYQFRGADIRNILDFERDYPEANIVRLERNYRSSGRILQAANAVIGNNRGRKGKNLWTDAGDGDLLRLGDCGDDRAEARHVVAAISSICEREGLGRRDAAVLYRTNAQSRALEEELQRGGVPYVIVGSIRFYERREIKDLLAYLRLLVNPADDVSLLRVINTPKRGIGATTVARLRQFADERRLSLLPALLAGEAIPGLNSRALNSLGDFADIFRELEDSALDRHLPELAEQVLVRSGYLEMLRAEKSQEAQSREENIGQLVARMTEFAVVSEDADLATFLEEVALMSPADEADGSADSVTLMTLHMAKGLEFPLVAISGLEENLFPTSRAVEESRTGSDDGIEEERRLFYVGVTRAQRFLVLSFARWRYAFGSLQEMKPSRFIEEIPRELVEVEEVAQLQGYGFAAAQRRESADRRRAVRRSQPSPPAPEKRAAPKGVHYEFDMTGARAQDAEVIFDGEVGDGDLLAVGRWVQHPILGRGQIVNREGAGEDLKLSIRFGMGKPKKIMVAYAQLEPG